MNEQTLGKLDEFMNENEVTGTCANGVCTVHGPAGKAEYSEVFEEFVPAFFAGAQVFRTQQPQHTLGRARVCEPCTHIPHTFAGHGRDDGGSQDDRTVRRHEGDAAACGEASK
jgi:hypothetical protein